MNHSAEHRKQLRVLTKVLVIFAVLVGVRVSLKYFQQDAPTHQDISLHVDLSQLAPGQAQQFLWQGVPVLVVHRTAAQLAALADAGTKLLDPESHKSRQPPALKHSLRSQVPEYLVVMGLGTDQGCPVGLQQVAGQSRLVDSCRGSLYDLSGRVLAGQYASRNLDVPFYRLQAPSTLILEARPPG